MKVAIYARMSTDKQSADSPADQVARCREFADRRGWAVVDELIAVDEGVSGASRFNRPGLLSLFDRIREWDVLLCWDSSRLGRDGEDLGWIRNQLRLHRRTGIEVSTELDLFNVGSKVMAVLNEEYLVKLRADTHRGLRGRVERGLSAGGCPFGYRSEPVEGGGSRWVVDPTAAGIVRRIFELFLSGQSYRAIANRLNSEGVPSPRPRAQKGKRASWAVSSVRALLLNPVYKGELIWNRSEWIKDHETGKRRRHERPESEWVRHAAPELAIVDAATWDEATAKIESRRGRAPRGPDGRLAGSYRGHRAGGGKGILSGFLECAECSGGFYAVTRGGRYGCGWHRDRGPSVCSSALRVSRGDLETRILGAIRNEVLTPERARFVVEEAVAIVQRELATVDEVNDADGARLAEVNTELRNLIRLAAKLGDLDEHAQLVAELRAERAAIERRLARSPSEEPAFDPDELVALAEEGFADLRATLQGSPVHARAALGSLLGDRRMRVGPDSERGFRVEGLFEWSPEVRVPGPLQERTGRLASVVAGEGFEPPTSGL